MMPLPPSRDDPRDRADVEVLGREFYRRAFADRLLGPVFVDVARTDLPEHLPIMRDFWESALFRAGTHPRNAFTVHVDLHRRVALTSDHFARWLALWTHSADDLYAGAVAGRAKTQTTRIAGSIHRRLGSATGAQPLSIVRARAGIVAVTACGAGKDYRPHSSHRPPAAGTTGDDHRISGDHGRERSQ